MLLSELVDTLHCDDAETTERDEVLRFGAYLGNPSSPEAPLPVVVDWEREGRELLRLGFPRPGPAGRLTTVLGWEVYNDLYLPPVEVRDRIYRVGIPVIGAPRSSEGVGTDFAFLLLAALVVPAAERPETILEACWPDGRRVLASVDDATWVAFEKVLARVVEGGRPKRVGPACLRCVHQGTCATWAALGEVMFVRPPAGATPKTEAHRLWLEWVLLRELGKKTEERRKAVANRLMQLAVGGEVDVNGLLRLVVSAQERQTWAFGAVYPTLAAAGLWKDDFATIRVGELKKAMANFPPALQRVLERAARTETVEPSFREAAAGTERTVTDGLQTSPFTGLHL